MYSNCFLPSIRARIEQKFLITFEMRHERYCLPGYIFFFFLDSV